MNVIKLRGSSGGEALVDEADYHWLSHGHWYLHITGYVRGYLKEDVRRMVLMHRLILSAPAKVTVDHANGNRLDNRRCNLRLATMSQQQANHIKCKGTSRFKGVYPAGWREGKWCAQIKAHGRPKIHLGTFDSELEAAVAYNVAAREAFGEYALLNKIEE